LPETAGTLTLAELGERFARFADEARTYAGPLYAVVSREIARDHDVLALARHVRRPPVPNVLLASVHFLLADTPTHPLARFYGSLSTDARPPDDAYPAFRDFVLANRSRLIPLLETRITQTNEVGRCSSLMPALTAVHQSGQGLPLALIDVGCSAGLHLLWDRYYYDYGTARVGNPDASVVIRCELRGSAAPPLPDRFPDCVFRLGIDLNPVDLSDPVERRWFESLIWPEHAQRRALAAAAIAELRRHPPRVVKGDAAQVLDTHLDAVPPGTLLVVYNSAALCQGGVADQEAVRSVLAAFSSRRTVYWLYCENEEVLLRTLDNGRMMERKLANKDGHGRWLEWL
jgi:hypothetical protein